VEGLVFLIVLIVLVVGGFLVFQNMRTSALGRRTETYLRSERQQSEGPRPRDPTVEDLRVGDAVTFWDGEDALVDCVLDCEEVVGTRRTRWRWNLLRGGRTLEVAPDGNVLYAPGEVAHQGSALFEQLTGDPATGGVLKMFEARVRAGTLGTNPVSFAYGGETFQMRSTGTFRATPEGPPPRAEVWRDVADDPSQNVYFEMESADGKQGLGIWTTHILVLVGDPLRATDIRAIYAGQSEQASS
jgi:hypothetical protein